MVKVKNDEKLKKFKRYIRRTSRNKICSGILFATGMASRYIDGDVTFFVFATLLSIALFFAKENWIY